MNVIRLRCEGYSLLLSLFALLGLSGIWYASVSLQGNEGAANQALELSLARTALISYAVNYVDHYGARGAGIGHLPCPDTDSPNTSHADAWHRDGPNPPCGRDLIELGWLPRHVNVRNGRYHFHTRSRQRLLYAVAAGFVNNPVGRAVNPSTRGGISVGNVSDVVAVIATPPLDADINYARNWFAKQTFGSDTNAYSLIRTGDVLDQAKQRVMSWLLKRLNNSLVRCRDTVGAASCVSLRKQEMLCLSTHSQLLLHWLGEHPLFNDCARLNQLLTSNLYQLESVPIKQHWFVRNDWLGHIDLRIDPICLSEASGSCRFTGSILKSDPDQLIVKLEPPMQPTVN